MSCSQENTIFSFLLLVFSFCLPMFAFFLLVRLRQPYSVGIEAFGRHLVLRYAVWAVKPIWDWTWLVPTVTVAVTLLITLLITRNLSPFWVCLG